MSRFVEVNITRQTKPLSQKGFGLPLVLSVSGDFQYKVYTEISEVAADFNETTEEYKLLSRMFGQNPAPAEIAVYGVLYDSGTGLPADLSAALNELQLTNDEFYYLVSTVQDDAEVEELASWVSTQDKIYAVSTSSETLYATLDGLYDNVYVLVHDQPGSYPAEGLVAHLAPQVIGSYTWTFKNISDVPAAAYDNTKINDIHTKHANTYISEGGVNITSNGVATSGEYIDVIQGQHFIQAKISENVFGLLVRQPKIPFTSAGIAQVVAEVEKALQLSGDSGIIAEENDEYRFSIQIPRVEDIPDNDKANRTLPDIPWTATIAGAIEDVTINGVLKI
jgi:hypothetical protein